MSVYVAVASDDGIKVNMHFGWARELLVYRVDEDGSYELTDERVVPELKEKSETSGNNNEVTDGDGPVKKFLEQSGAGCGNGHSCGENFKHVNVDELIDAFSDCKYILALKIGKIMERIFKAKGISCFSVDLTIDEALKNIAEYENRISGRMRSKPDEEDRK